MEGTRIVISKSASKKQVPKGSGFCAFTEQVVYHKKVGKRMTSVTRHELARGK